MSQNQCYFWQTTRHNVYLKRSAKYRLMLALMAIISFSTVCLAEIDPKLNDNNNIIGEMIKIKTDDQNEKPISDNDVKNAENPNNDIPPPDNEITKKPNMNKNIPDLGFIHAFVASISVILVSELGDKTFFIAAIMAMRHPRLTVFLGAILALALMTILSAFFGMAATIIPRVYTYYISTALFAIFGLKMLKEGYYMSPADTQEELEEVHSDIRKRDDELMRSARARFEDLETERKIRKSNDAGDNNDDGGDDDATEHFAMMINNNCDGDAKYNSKDAKMKHRQRKHLNNNNNDLNGGRGGCERIETKCNEIDTFLDVNNVTKHNNHPCPLMPSSTKVVAAAMLSDTQNSTDGAMNDTKFNNSTVVMVHSQSASAISTSRYINDQMKSISVNDGINHVTGVKNMKGIVQLTISNGSGSGKYGMQREVVQDPESGVIRKNVKRSATYLATRVLMQSFTMTFLAEWGDRSQLTTIILSAREDVYGVVVGGILGHSFCTGLAVLGGRMIAQKISVRAVTIVGGIVFLIFAFSALFMSPNEN